MPSRSKVLTLPANTVIEFTTSGKESVSGKTSKRKAAVLDTSSRKAGTFDRYISGVIKRIDGNVSLSAKAVAVLDAMITDLGTRICSAAGDVTRFNKRTTVTMRDAQAAILLVLKGELGKKAVAESYRAIQVYEKFNKGISSSTSERCQLIFPVPRVSTMLKSKTNLRAGLLPAIMICAALEYSCSEILELASKAIKEVDRSRIMPRFIRMVIESDVELNRLFPKSSFING